MLIMTTGAFFRLMAPLAEENRGSKNLWVGCTSFWSFMTLQACLVINRQAPKMSIIIIGKAKGNFGVKLKLLSYGSRSCFVTVYHILICSWPVFNGPFAKYELLTGEGEYKKEYGGNHKANLYQIVSIHIGFRLPVIKVNDNVTIQSGRHGRLKFQMSHSFYP